MPWEITRSANYHDISYLYDANDARIYKEVDNTPLGLQDFSEYYLRSASGQELGIYNFEDDELTWYVYGTDRVAKFEHLPTFNDWPGELEDTLGGGGGSGGLSNGGTVLADAVFADASEVDREDPATQEKLAFVEKLLNPDGTYNLPNQMYYISWKSDSTEFYMTEEEISAYDTTQYDLLLQMPLNNERQRLQVARIGGGEITISLGELAGLSGNIPPNPNPGSQDPYDPDLPGILNAPTPKWSYYIYDHLGNTRVVYKVDLSDICVGGDTTIYILENVEDYFPYGKRLRGMIGGNGEEKFLTTQHERDLETGLDYRGARFYDSDVGRFLSLDPLAVDYVNWSDYNYVLDNPIAFIDPSGKAPQTVYEDSETGEQVEVKDGIDKTIVINSTDFQKKKEFASIDKIKNQYDLPGDEWSQSDQQEYYTFYNSVNSYDGASISNVFDYFFGGPDDGVIEIAPGGPVGKTGGTSLGSVLPRVPKGKAFYDVTKDKIVKGGQWMRKKMDGYLQVFKKGENIKKTPNTHTEKGIRDADRSMEELLKDYGRFLKDHVDNPPDIGG